MSMLALRFSTIIHRLGESLGTLDWATCVILCFMVLAMPCQAQSDDAYLYDWAVRPNSNPQQVSYGYVEQMNGHLHLEFPIGEARHNRSGSGTSQVRLVYDSNFWYPDSVGAGYAWFPGESWHLLPTQAWSGFMWNGSQSNPIEYQELSDQNGAMHYFPCAPPNCYSTDGEGYALGAGWGQMYAPDGSHIYDYYGGNYPYQTATDANGNFTLLGYGDGAFYDTSNILDEHNSSAWIYTGTGDINTGPGPYLNKFYYVPDMASGGIPNSSPPNASPQYTEHDVNISVKTSFGDNRVPVAECSPTGPLTCIATVVSQLVLPDGTSFTFKYDCDATVAAQQAYCTSVGGKAAYYGALTEMTTPTSQIFKYSYAPFFDAYQDGGLGLASRTDADGTWTYTQTAISECSGPTATGCEQTLTTTAPNGRKTIVTTIQNNGPWPVSELVTDGSGNNLSLTNTQWDFSHPNLWLGYASAYIRKQSETTTLWDSGGAAETKKTAYTYDSPERGSITKMQQWGYYSGINPSFSSISDKTTYTTYYAPTDSPIADQNNSFGKGGTNIIHKPSSVTVCNSIGSDSACPGGGTRVSQTIINYDQYGSSGPVSVTGIANHDDEFYGSGQLVRGNPTSIKQWVSGATYISKSMQYDTTGQVTSSSDGNGNATSYDYTDNYYIDNGTSTPSAYSPPASTHAFATTVTLPSVNGQIFSTKTGYYYGNQKPAFTTDANNNSTYYHYSDPLDRLTETVYPLGWTLTKYTSPTETDIYTALSSPSPSSGCTGCLHTSILVDGMQRVIQVISPNGSKVDTSYDSMGLIRSVSNPYLAYSDPTYGLTYYAYDTLGRLCLQSNPDNSSGNTSGCTPRGSSAVAYSYVVNGGYKTDENGNTWAYLYDPLGRLASVSEPNGGMTRYTYNVLGSLTGVAQSGAVTDETPRLRSFTYDGVLRLLTASNPESGIVCYGIWSGGSYGTGFCQNGYDGNGNLLTKTSPLANAASGTQTQTVSYTYDALNRLTQAGYPVLPAGATPNYSYSCYQYDTSPNSTASGTGNFIGRLTNNWTQISGSPPSSFVCPSSMPPTGALTGHSILAYDPMGRVLSSQQCILSMCTTNSKPFQLSQIYDLAGNPTLVTQSLIPGMVPKLELASYYDGAGRLRNVESSWDGKPNSSNPLNLFLVQSYSPASGLQNWMLGNYLNFQKTYDIRNRPVDMVVTHP